MRPLIVKQLDYDLTPVVWLSLMGHLLNSIFLVFERFDSALPINGSVADGDRFCRSNALWRRTAQFGHRLEGQTVELLRRGRGAVFEPIELAFADHVHGFCVFRAIPDAVPL